MIFQSMNDTRYSRIGQSSRVRYYANYEQMWDLACLDDRKYTVFQSEFLRITSKARCKLEPMGRDYFNIWITAGIAKDFTHKPAINLG